ncbi:MAG: hypothetical protein HDR88_02580 [Bacteroides sp.]|nr:hypothetical protein [Bacteroides sp.]
MDTPSLHILSHADSLLDSLPDSALNILSTIDRQDLKTPEEKARYSLLYTMALLKTEQEIPNDSVLIPAIEYFGKTNTPSREAMLTHFAMGALSDSAMQKLKEYDKTIELLAGKNSKVYHALALFHKGRIYGQSYSSPDELECKRQGLKIIHETNDTESIIYGHLIYGMGLNANDQSDDALKEFFTGLDISAASGIDTYTPLLSREKGYTYSLLGEHDKAMEVFDSLQQINGIEFTPEDLYALARSAAATGNFSLADQIMASLAGEDTPEDKCNFYFSQAAIMAYRGNYKEAYHSLSDSMTPYTNMILMAKLDGNLSRQEKEIALLTANHQEEIAERRNAQFIIMCICGVIAVALLSACIYILILRHRRRIREEEIKLQQLKTETEAQTQTLMERIEQLDYNKKLTNSVLQSLRTNIHDLESQKIDLENAVSHLEDTIRLLEKEIDSKDYSTAQIEEKARDYAGLIESLRTQLKSSDTTIARLREQSRKDFKMLHKGSALFCNEMPKGLSSPDAIRLYETQRDIRIKQYSDPTIVKSLEAQINDIFDNVLNEITKAISLSETDVKTLIYDICGFNYKSIALLLNVTPSAAAARRSRIKEKVINSNNDIPPKYIEFLNL